jgi:hypothetical protein
VTSADRLRELRGAVLDALEQCDVPFSAGWIVEHRVTLDEVLDLMDDVRARLEFAEVDYHRNG